MSEMRENDIKTLLSLCRKE